MLRDEKILFHINKNGQGPGLTRLEMLEKTQIEPSRNTGIIDKIANAARRAADRFLPKKL